MSLCSHSILISEVESESSQGIFPKFRNLLSVIPVSCKTMLTLACRSNALSCRYNYHKNSDEELPKALASDGYSTAFILSSMPQCAQLWPHCHSVCYFSIHFRRVQSLLPIASERSFQYSMAATHWTSSKDECLVLRSTRSYRFCKPGKSQCAPSNVLAYSSRQVFPCHRI